MIPFECKCKKLYCSKHRYAEDHNCTYDYQTEYKKIFKKNNPKVVAEKMDIDIYEVIKAAATKPFGFTPYYPGPGLGGHCIPIDPHYLSWKLKTLD